MIAATAQSVLEQAADWTAQGEAVALVTLVGIEGSSSRSLGTLMAITAGGQSVGSFSGGCIDSAIIGEAQRVLGSNRGSTVRFGLGSPFIDIRLPCGGGIDLQFTPNPTLNLLHAVCAELRGRRPVELRISPAAINFEGDGFELHLAPKLRILAFGQGEDLTAFAKLVGTFGASLELFSPKEAERDQLRELGHRAEHLAQTSSVPDIRGDDWTAAVFLFHDRDWEDALIPHALNLPNFYCGAIGSRRTHEARLVRLAQAGCSNETLARLKGHIGLIPATRDPATLAVSVLAEIVSAYNRVCSKA